MTSWTNRHTHMQKQKKTGAATPQSGSSPVEDLNPFTNFSFIPFKILVFSLPISENPKKTNNVLRTNVIIFYYFAPYFEEYGSKIFLSTRFVFLPDVCHLSLCTRASIGFSRVRMSIFFHQNVGNLPLNAIEKVKFLKTFKIWFFFQKEVERFFEKQSWSSSDLVKVVICCRMRKTWRFFFKMCFQTSLWCLIGKKTENFERWKNQKIWWKTVFLQKKSFLLSKLQLYQIGEVQKMPVVPGRLVKDSLGNNFFPTNHKHLLGSKKFWESNFKISGFSEKPEKREETFFNQKMTVNENQWTLLCSLA